MERRALVDKLLELTELRAGEIAERWYKSVSTNPRTPSYRSLPKEKSVLRATSLYKNLKQMYFSDNPYQEVLQFLEGRGYVESLQADGIPLHEAIYALVMMRRHIWLYAELQALFTTPMDMYQATEGINRTLLLFDYAAYIIAQKYQKPNRSSV